VALQKTIRVETVAVVGSSASALYYLYFHTTASGTILTGIHVNDFFVSLSCFSETYKFKLELASIWEISNLGKSHFCVGIIIEHDLIDRHIFLLQMALIDKILEQFKMIDCNPVSTPIESGLILLQHSDTSLTWEEEMEIQQLPYHCLVSLLMYLAIGMWPNLALAIQKIRQFMVPPSVL